MRQEPPPPQPLSDEERYIRKFQEQLRETALRSFRLSALREQGGSCFWCKKPVKKKLVTADHLIPRSRGGKDEQNNIVASCAACNSKRGKKLPPLDIAKARGLVLPPALEGE